MGKINLKAYSSPAKVFNYGAGDILKKTRLNQELLRLKQSYGLVTSGMLEATQVSGEYGWAISSYIGFDYSYTSCPNFTWGLDGTAGLPDGIDWGGENTYSEALPSVLASLTTGNYQPAIFIPRVIHWHIEETIYLGCYLLVCQVNSSCTETDKTVRIHYRFEGNGN